MIKAIIFDMDGTLLDSIPAHYQAWIRAAKKAGAKNVTTQSIKEYNGLPTFQIAKHFIRTHHLSLTPQMLTHFKDQEYDHAIRRVKLFPGTQRVLLKLKKQYRLVLATSASRDNVMRTTAMRPLMPFFEHIITSQDVRKGKPNPEIWHVALGKLKLKKTEAVIVDDVSMGILAAKRLGVRNIAVATSFPRREMHGADLIIQDISKLTPRHIAKLEKT